MLFPGSSALQSRREGREHAAGPGPVAERAAALLVAAQLLLSLTFAFVWRPHVLGSSFADSGLVGGSLWIHVLTVVSTWSNGMGWLLLPLQSSTSDVAHGSSRFSPRGAGASRQ